jgi:hypothetical protein
MYLIKFGLNYAIPYVLSDEDYLFYFITLQVIL